MLFYLMKIKSSSQFKINKNLQNKKILLTNQKFYKFNNYLSNNNFNNSNNNNRNNKRYKILFNKINLKIKETQSNNLFLKKYLFI